MTSEGGERHPVIAVALEDEGLRGRLIELLGEFDAEVTCPDVEVPGWWEGDARSADVVILGRPHVADESSRARLHEAVVRGPEVLVITDREDPVERAELLAAGASVVVDTHPLVPSDLRRALARALASRGGAQPETGGSRIRPRLADFISRCPRMQAFLDLVHRVKDTDSSLLIAGETGVGKEHLARAIHAESSRRDGPFIDVNCGAIPEHLLESELFGHEKGAFTGAATKRAGRFREASGGTIFLDEIADLPKHLQVNLLTVLHRREVWPVGGDHPCPIDVRVMAASNRDLIGEVREGSFREDLYFRLAVITLTIPPLRERREDLPDLIGACMRHFRHALDRQDVEGIDPAAMDALLHHEWPGNVRELINVIERAMLLCRGRRVTLEDLPQLTPAASRRVQGASADPESLVLPRAIEARPFQQAKREVVEQFETAYFRRVLERTGGRVGESAKLAGVAERTLFEKMKHLGLRKEDFRER
jgi:two-component system response regulator AtoC